MHEVMRAEFARCCSHGEKRREEKAFLLFDLVGGLAFRVVFVFVVVVVGLGMALKIRARTRTRMSSSAGNTHETMLESPRVVVPNESREGTRFSCPRGYTAIRVLVIVITSVRMSSSAGGFLCSSLVVGWWILKGGVMICFESPRDVSGAGSCPSHAFHPVVVRLYAPTLFDLGTGLALPARPTSSGTVATFHSQPQRLE